MTEQIWRSQYPWGRESVSPLRQDSWGSERWINSSNITWLQKADFTSLAPQLQWEFTNLQTSSVEGAMLGRNCCSWAREDRQRYCYWAASWGHAVSTPVGPEALRAQTMLFCYMPGSPHSAQHLPVSQWTRGPTPERHETEYKFVSYAIWNGCVREYSSDRTGHILHQILKRTYKPKKLKTQQDKW